jgi:hypothetical protein
MSQITVPLRYILERYSVITIHVVYIYNNNNYNNNKYYYYYTCSVDAVEMTGFRRT